MNKSWIHLGNYPNAAMVVDALNEKRCTRSVTIGRFEDGSNFSVWAFNKEKPKDSKRTWKYIGDSPDGNAISDLMNENKLDSNCSVVSLNGPGSWSLWGFRDFEEKA